MFARRPSTAWRACLLTVLISTSSALAEQSQTRSDSADEKKSADEEIEELVGPTYSETMVVTASRNEVSLLDVPIATTVVTEEQIEVQAADNVADLLRGTPGLQVIQANARDVNIASRGGGGLLVNSQLVLVDGRSIYLDYIGVVLWDTLPFHFDEIAQVEVQSGPGSAVWGANAVNGVVNFRTKSPRELEGGRLTLGFGEKGHRSAGVRWAQAFDKYSYKISASHTEQDSYDRDEKFPDGTPYPLGVRFDNRSPAQHKFDFRLDYEPGNDRRWTYEAGVGSYGGIVHSSIGPYWAKPSAYFGYGAFTYDGPSLDAKVYYNFLRSDAPNLFAPPAPTYFNTDTYVAELSGSKAVGEHHFLVYGGQARLLELDITVIPDEDSRTEAGFWLEDQIWVNPKLQLAIGARFDWFDTFGWTVSPRMTTTIKPAPNHSIRLAFQQAYRSPAAVENFLKTSAFGSLDLYPDRMDDPPFFYPFIAIGNPDLVEERVDAIEIGYTGVFNQRTTFSATLFWNNVEDNINFVPISFYGPDDPPPGWEDPPYNQDPNDLGSTRFLPNVISYVNYGKVRDRGIELHLLHEARNGVFAQFAYTYRDDPSVNSEGAPIPVSVNVPPKHTASARLGIKRKRAWGSVGLAYTDRAFWTDVFDPMFAGYTEDYTLLDGTLGVNLPHGVELVFKATNLLDDDVKQHIFGDVIDRRAWMELRFNWD